MLLTCACAGVRTPPEPPASVRDTTAVPATADPSVTPFIVTSRDATSPDTSLRAGIHVRLTDVAVRPGVSSPPPVIRPIPAADADALLDRLAGPSIPAPAPPVFRFAIGSLPAPRPGATTRIAFAAGTGGAAVRPPAVAIAGPLRAVHTTPRGVVSTTSQVAVTFSRAMVPLSALDATVPGVRLSPATPGAWRWLDPATLVFEAAGELPKATRYTVEIPAGFTAADGAVLGEAVRWTFTTSPPAVRDVVSTDLPTAAQPVIAVVFDQAIDTAAVLPFLRLDVDGRDVPLRFASDEERKLWRVDYLLRNAPARTIAVRPAEPIGGNTDGDTWDAKLHVAPGLPSLEGPVRTDTAFVHAFSIRKGMRVVEHGCGRAESCVPGVPWTIRFTHSLQPLADTASLVRVEPALPGATVEVWNDHIVVLGSPRPNTTYTVRLDPAIATWGGGELGPVPPLRFDVGHPAPSVWTPGGGIALLQRASKAFVILAEGTDSVRVEVRAVTPADWPAYVRVRESERAGMRDIAALPGRVLTSTLLPVRAVEGGPGEAVLELDEALNAAGGHLLLAVQPARSAGKALPVTDSAGALAQRPALTWVQRDAIVLDVAEDGEALTVRALSPSGRPLAGIQLELHAAGSMTPSAVRVLARGRTGADGVAVLTAPYDDRPANWLLVASTESTTVLFPATVPGDYPCCGDYQWRPGLRRHFVTDRPIYARGDTVRFVGWLRRVAGAGREPAAPAAGVALAYTARDPRGATLVEDTIRILPNGRVEGSFVLPPEVNAGDGSIWLTLPDEPGRLTAWLQFQVQDVRRPNFDVTLELDPGPHLPGSRVGASAHARYFTGGGLPAAAVRWQVSSSPASYVPPGVADYSFGRMRLAGRRWLPPKPHTGRSDAAGVHRLAIDIDSTYPGVAMNLHVYAGVTDVDQQGRTAVGNVIVHPAAVYVGLRTPSRFVRAGETVNVDALVVDLDGQAVAGRPIALRALRQERRFEPTGLVVTEAERGRCAVASQAGPVTCRLDGLTAGDYMIVATVEDAHGRRSESEIAVRVAAETIPAAAGGVRDRVVVEPDRKKYEPGDTAIVLIQTSFPAAAALLTLRRAGVLASRGVKVENGVATVRLPVQDAHVPNLELHVTAVAPDGRMAAASAPVAVAASSRTLRVSVEPADEVAPGAATTVLVRVADGDGRPVAGADVVLSGVDEALIALRRQPVSNPIDEFYPTSGPEVTDRTLRAHVAPALVRTTAPARGAGPTGTVTGVVIDGVTGRPVRGAWVELPGVAGGAWTGVDGGYRLASVPAGEHLLQARATGYVTGHLAGVAVPVGGTGRAHFLLLTRQAILAGGRSGVVQNRLGGVGRELRSMDAAALLSEVRVTSAAYSSEGEYAIVASPPPPGPPGEGVLLRKDFTPVAAFVVDARTGADGRVEIPLTVPHSLTRYRLRAVAAAGDRRFGAGEASLTVRRSLMVRPMPPRFLHQGDRFELPVLVENRSGTALEVDVAVRAANAQVAEPFGRRVSVPANDRVELRFPAVAGASGTARFQVAVSADVSDAAEAVVPVLLPAVTETFAVYGEIDDARPVAYPLRLPVGALPDQTHVEIGFATTAAHGLRDALDFLRDCFFELPEVWASRIIALDALRHAPAATAWPVEAIDASIRADVLALARTQLPDGGWSVWTTRFDADPFVSVHAAHALQRARAAGVPVPQRALTAAVQWLERLDDHAPGRSGPPAASRARVVPVDYPVQARRAVQAYALDVRRRLGSDVSASAAALLREAGAGALPAEALAWLLPALAAQPEYAQGAADVRRELGSRVVRSAGTAAVVSPYDAGGQAVLYSARRTDAVVLTALVDTESAPELVAAMARGLLAHRVRGRWSNTQENAFAVAALARYLAAAEATAPDLIARAWTGARLAAEQPFRGRADGRSELAVPADSLGQPGTELDLTLARTGAGRVYYRVALSHARAGLTPAVTRGFEVTRTYEAVDDSADVRRDDDGTWRIRRGARVRVRVTVGAPGPRYHVAVIDPLAAGFEAVNPALAGTAGTAQPALPTPTPSDRLPFFAEHVNVRAERFEAFRTLLQPGRRDITYFVLATTAGDFAAPAPRAEEMYAPETLGRGAAERVVVEDAGR